MPDWADKLENFLDPFSRALNSTVKTLYPPGFDQQDDAYQLAWIEQHIPIMEKTVLALQAEAKNSPHVAAAEAPVHVNASTSLRDGLKDLAMRFQGFGEVLTLETARNQLVDLKSRKAALLAKVPAPQSPPAAKPTPQQQRAQTLANVAALEAERDKILPTISDQNIRRAVQNAYQDKIQKELEKL